MTNQQTDLPSGVIWIPVLVAIGIAMALIGGVVYTVLQPKATMTVAEASVVVNVDDTKTISVPFTFTYISSQAANHAVGGSIYCSGDKSQQVVIPLETQAVEFSGTITFQTTQSSGTFGYSCYEYKTRAKAKGSVNLGGKESVKNTTPKNTNLTNVAKGPTDLTNSVWAFQFADDPTSGKVVSSAETYMFTTGVPQQTISACERALTASGSMQCVPQLRTLTGSYNGYDIYISNTSETFGSIQKADLTISATLSEDRYHLNGTWTLTIPSPLNKTYSGTFVADLISFPTSQ